MLRFRIYFVGGYGGGGRSYGGFGGRDRGGGGRYDGDHYDSYGGGGNRRERRQEEFKLPEPGIVMFVKVFPESLKSHGSIAVRRGKGLLVNWAPFRRHCSLPNQNFN